MFRNSLRMRRLLLRPPVSRDPRELASYGLVVVGIMAIAVILHHLFVLNVSPSVPRGLYVRWLSVPVTGELVLFRPHRDVSTWYEELTGDELSRGFLKPIYATGPFTICRQEDNTLELDGAALPSSSLAPRFLAVNTCRDWEDGVFFVLSTRVANSFDSRHYGPVSTTRIDGTFRPALVWD